MNRELHAVIMPGGDVQLEWSPSEERVSKSRQLLEQEISRRFGVDRDSAFLFLGFSDKSIHLSDSINFWRAFAGMFAERIRMTTDREQIRGNITVSLSPDEARSVFDSAPLMIGAEYLNVGLLENIWYGLNRCFVEGVRHFKGTVEEFIRSYSPNVHLIGRVYFHLVENKKDDAPFAFLATYSTGLNAQGTSRHLPLKYALEEFGKDNEKLLDLLSTVHLAARESRLMTEMIESGEIFHPLSMTTQEAYTFLKEVAIYENAGILCRIPNWWKGPAQGVRLRITAGDQQPSHVGMDALLDFRPELLLGDMVIPEEEARRLLLKSEGLAWIKNRWVAVDPEKLKQTLDAYEKARDMITAGEVSFRDAMRMQLDPKSALGVSDQSQDIELTNGRWLDTVLKKLRNPESIDFTQTGKALKADLRPYQQKGVNWLVFLHSLRLGICLADDMGLGKTVQVIGLLTIIKSQEPGLPSLIVVPASLLSNWENELTRFAPDLVFGIAHPGSPTGRKIEPKGRDSLKGIDLVITTYSIVQRYEWLHEREWNYIILDEAQAIKNPGAKQTRSIKRLKAQNRIAMTGTPVENRLSDLWSLFDFINPGLLGGTAEFGRFAKALHQSPEGYARLRRIISPYILRRLKTDKTVISDLPEKVEMKTYASLSKKQLLLYKEMVRELKEAIEQTEGIQRKGLVLSSLMKFKQLCNHPDQYLGTGGYDEEESGKFGRLREICETILEKREKVLVFTQFREIAGHLKAFLDSVFGREGLILHGGTAVAKRKDLIDKFQSASYVPFLVLSLKAGGVGLNLTAANHVIHFDRWWNPAVENQATDRAFRIGQKKGVVVHKFLTEGTIEEKIDKMIEGKIKLAQEVIQSGGEDWITEMNNAELIELFSLSV
ncbi:MAG: DEAD/DEAH box helicase [Thermodesulfovibrionales bacterium]|jgi:non-specific serine/threonine protein kinase